MSYPPWPTTVTVELIVARCGVLWLIGLNFAAIMQLPGRGRS